MKSHNRKFLSKGFIRLLAFLLLLFLFFISSNPLILPSSGATQQEAWDEIISAFDKVQQASTEGIDVSSLTDQLNDAIEAYELSNYDTAYDTAHSVLLEAEDLITNNRWSRIFPYVLIPINVVLIAAVVVFFGRYAVRWYRIRRDEEF
ncbi:MAG: hypothetical protein KAS22_12170, partial [Candidatus Heimdallarchaeota archaeon]|nr:hypothetical protein [Candidatus Heimdallarchaeota archaeon]